MAWPEVTVAVLRTEAARDPHNKELHDLIGEISTRSDEFRRLWGAHNVRHHGSGFKTFHHATVGEVTLAYEGMYGSRTRSDTDDLHARTRLPVGGTDPIARVVACQRVHQNGRVRPGEGADGRLTRRREACQAV